MRIPRTLHACAAAVLAATLLAAGPSRGEWWDPGLDALRLGNFGSAVELAQRNIADRGISAEVLQFGAHVLQWSRGRDANAAVRVKYDYPGLHARVTLGEVPLLQRLVELGDPALTKYATALQDEASGRLAGPDQARSLPAMLPALPPDRRAKVIGGLHAWLAGERGRVEQGGALSPEVRAAFEDAQLIASLARNLTVEPTTKDKALGLLPAKFQAAVAPLVGQKGARDCLVLIEEPAMPVLEAMRGELGPAVDAIIADIRVAKATREIRYPGSTWYAARPQ